MQTKPSPPTPNDRSDIRNGIIAVIAIAVFLYFVIVEGDYFMLSKALWSLIKSIF